MMLITFKALLNQCILKYQQTKLNFSYAFIWQSICNWFQSSSETNCGAKAGDILTSIYDEEILEIVVVQNDVS